MNIIIAQNSGFCDGVKRAMRIALAAAARHGEMVADGPLVHNRQAVALLALRGVGGEDDGRKPVLIRAHGIPPERRAGWEAEGRTVVDATCVHVAANQRLARDAAGRGLTVVLAGDREHAETRAVAASAGADCRIVSSLDEVVALKTDRGVFFLAQTTFNVKLFEEMACTLRWRFPDCEIADTICRATHDRQIEAERLARRADVLVVVGGRHSANTQRLADAARRVGRPVFSVETAEELRPEDFVHFRTAAVTSGSSTPGWVTQDVVNRLRGLGRPTFRSIRDRCLQHLVESRLSLALGAWGLAVAAQFFLLGDPAPFLALAGACYIFFAHTLNRRVPCDPKARRLSLVDAWYQKRRSRLLTLAWLAAGASLPLSASAGPTVLALFALAVLAATLHAKPQGADAKKRPTPRHWPMALGWALTLAGPAALLGNHGAAGLGALLFVFLVCLGGTLVRDLHDISSDRLMGIDTLPTRLGPMRARRLAAWSLGTATALPLLAAALRVAVGGRFSFQLLFLLLMPAALGIGLLLLEKVADRRVNDATMVQAGVDGIGCLAGLLALACWGLSL